MDADLAEIYGVTAKRLNEQVKRNAGRFPEDFAFQLSPGEFADLRSQIATSKEPTRSRSVAGPGRGGHLYVPYAFTEHGAIMAAKELIRLLGAGEEISPEWARVLFPPGTLRDVKPVEVLND